MDVIRGRLFAFIVVLGLVLMAVVAVLGLQFSDSVRRLSQAPRDNAVWAIFQLEYEMERTRTAIAALEPGDAESREVFAHRFDVFYSRYDTILQARGFQREVSLALETREWRDIKAFMDRITPAIDQNRTDIAANKNELAVAFTNMVPIVRRFTVGIIQDANARNAQLYHSLLTTVGMAAALLLVMMVGLICVIYVLLVQGRALELGQRALSASERFNRAITAASLDGVIVFDRVGRIVEYGHASGEIFGFARESMLGANILDLLTPKRLRKRLLHMLDHAQADLSTGRRLEVRALNAGGREIPVEISLRALQAEEGAMFVAFVRDITARKADARRLQQARERAEAESARKARYAAFVSHEIRTPLNSLLLVIDLLRSPNSVPERDELLASAAAASEALLGIVNEVLDLSRLEAGAMGIEKSPQNVRQLLQQVREVALPLARHRGNEIAIETDAQIKPVLADAERLKQVLLNLIGNAVKATVDGKITVDAKLVRRVAGTDLIEFSVQDTGVGIEPDRLAVIFEEFTTFGSGAPARLTGAGLGLPIARRLIAAMGGDIEVDSTPGNGSRFHFRLRLQVADHDPAEAQVEALEATAFRRLNILVVDDDDLNRMALERVLARAGHDVKIAASGEAALEMAQAAHFDVIFVDQLMPGMDGVETVRRIRALKPGGSAEARIIGVTAFASEEDRVRLKQAGAEDYLPKPLRRQAVEQVLLRVTGPVHALS
jgi:PAS domain S-box-containing protein